MSQCSSEYRSCQPVVITLRACLADLEVSFVNVSRKRYYLLTVCVRGRRYYKNTRSFSCSYQVQNAGSVIWRSAASRTHETDEDLDAPYFPAAFAKMRVSRRRTDVRFKASVPLKRTCAIELL